MVVHTRTRLLPYQRKELAKDYFVTRLRKKDLMAKYGVSYPTIQKILARAKQDATPSTKAPTNATSV